MMTTYREHAKQPAWFICSVCYQTIARDIQPPCGRCGDTRVPLDDNDVRREFRAYANRRLLARADLESTRVTAPLVALVMKWTGAKSAAATLCQRRRAALGTDDEFAADVRADDRGTPALEFFGECLPIDDPLALSIPDLLRWLKVVVEE